MQYYILSQRNVYKSFLFAQEISHSWQWQRSYNRLWSWLAATIMRSAQFETNSLGWWRFSNNPCITLLNILEHSTRMVSSNILLDCRDKNSRDKYLTITQWPAIHITIIRTNQHQSLWFSRQNQIWIYGHVPAKLVISNVPPPAVALPEFRLLRRSGDR